MREWSIVAPHVKKYRLHHTNGNYNNLVAVTTRSRPSHPNIWEFTVGGVRSGMSKYKG